MQRLEICAEMSANHCGSFGLALEIVEAAARAGADCLKVQVWEPETMCVSNDYRIEGGPWAGRKLRDLYREAWTPWEWLPEIFARARGYGMRPFGAAFDKPSVDYLEALKVDRHKVASFELVDLPLIRYMASKGKPVLISTGMGSPAEIAAAREAAPDHLLLRCTSAYPAPLEEANLASMDAEEKWGLSDHSLGHTVSAAAAARGACYIERHITIDRTGLDAGFSLTPSEFATMAKACRDAAATIGRRVTGPTQSESPVLRRSLWVVRDTDPGQPLVLGENVRTARPALGLPCSMPLTVAARALKAGQPLTLEDLA